ncbi:MAG: hypothetical protein U0800_05735 [Isosphaeraceae bacterium]
MKTTTAGRAGACRSGGFTLIEIGIVIMIIGLLSSFILVVSMQGIERAKERATQSLIAKLDALVNERLQLLLSQQVDANLTHRYLADPNYPIGSFPIDPSTGAPDPTRMPAASQRADIIARADYIKAQMPDVFFIQVDPNNLSATSNSVVYPLNFGGYFPQGNPPFSLGGTQSINSSPTDKYILPLGNSVYFNPLGNNYGAVPLNYATNPPTPVPPPGYSAPGTGIYGAAYTAAAGLLKNLGNAQEQLIGMTPAPYLSAGYNGVDDNGNGYVDDFSEGVNATNFAAVQACLKNHRHSTARAEALYAFLIESPGATVGRDSFKDTEVADTDGDGMPEFVDAWGNPVLFFRWPTYYNSDVQKGVPWDGASAGTYRGSVPYTSYSDRRETNPLDPNGQLVSPVWWARQASNPPWNTVSAYPGYLSFLFQQMYFSLLDPTATATIPESPASVRWDRTGYFKRRGFQNRFLILSAGPDGLHGVPLLNDGDPADGRIRSSWGNATSIDGISLDLNLVEGSARPFQFNFGTNAFPIGNATYDGLRPGPGDPSQVPVARATPQIVLDGYDDISNHNLRVSGAAAR